MTDRKFEITVEDARSLHEDLTDTALKTWLGLQILVAEREAPSEMAS